MQVNKEHIKLLKQGDAKTQKWVFESLYAKMFRVCQRYLVRTDEAEDCMMKAFMKAFQQLDAFTYEHEQSFVHWLKRIMVNESLMALRKQQNLSLATLSEEIDKESDDDFFAHIAAKDLLDALLKLPVGYRTVFNLFVIEGYTHQEIAAELNISESTSKSQLFKAKQRLQVLLTQSQYGYGKAK
ncbi:MAG: sigma-70 family RNA polymerase sigma factor [Bacteroidia bacterium]|nr:sigma-70 family RNA polymerase sigma factor [Bacteroidia bacterium]